MPLVTRKFGPEQEKTLARPLLSLCMIVKNEETMLPELLSSVDGLWDEFIVADTGSTDGTVALLETAGATVITHPWDDDFAAARNASLAPATGQWVLFLDADERVTPELKAQIQAVVKDEKAGAATVVMRNALPGGLHRDANLMRLFRNDPAIRFRHRIHEDVLEDVEAYLSRTGQQLRHLSGVVQHLGYVREVAADREKKQRDEDLLRRTLAEDPTDFYCWFKLLELARFWEDKKLWNSVAAEVEPLLAQKLAPEQLAKLKRNPWSGELAALISQGAFPAAAESLAWLERWQDQVHTGAAWHLRRAILLENLGRDKEAEAAFGACLADRNSGSGHHVRALLGQCRVAVRAENLERVMDLATKAVTLAPADPEALLAVVTFRGLMYGQQQVTDFALRHQAEFPSAATPLAEALLSSGHAGAALKLLTGLVAQEPPLAMGLLTCTLALGQDVDLDVDLDQDTADLNFRKWIRILWESRRTELMTVFAENCGSVTGVFPWLEEYLAAETERLKRPSEKR